MPAKKPSNLVPTAISLPPEMHALLKQSGGDRGLSEEIRRRLQASLDAERTSDAETRTLVEMIAQAARNTSEFYGAWHKDAFSFQAFKAATNWMLNTFEPKGEPVAKPNSDSLADVLFDEAGGPEAVGRSIAAIVQYSEQKSQRTNSKDQE